MLLTERDNGMRFVVDTHALWWYLKSSTRLSRKAADIFQKAAAGEATIIVPAIVVAEFYFLSVKFGEPMSPSELIDAIRTARGFEFSNLGRAQLERLDTIEALPEMHDRLIAAEAVILNAPVITRDRAFSDSPQIETVW